jgi:hypothetical protein
MALLKPESLMNRACLRSVPVSAGPPPPIHARQANVQQSVNSFRGAAPDRAEGRPRKHAQCPACSSLAGSGRRRLIFAPRWRESCYGIRAALRAVSLAAAAAPPEAATMNCSPPRLRSLPRRFRYATRQTLLGKADPIPAGGARRQSARANGSKITACISGAMPRPLSLPDDDLGFWRPGSICHRGWCTSMRCSIGSSIGQAAPRPPGTPRSAGSRITSLAPLATGTSPGRRGEIGGSTLSRLSSIWPWVIRRGQKIVHQPQHRDLPPIISSRVARRSPAAAGDKLHGGEMVARGFRNS